jgi:hypothetical protein
VVNKKTAPQSLPTLRNIKNERLIVKKTEFESRLHHKGLRKNTFYNSYSSRRFSGY